MQYSGGLFILDRCLVNLDIQALKEETLQIGLKRTKWLFSRKIAVQALMGPNINLNFIEIGLTAHTDLIIRYIFPG
jgi:hypothetical protein